MAMNLTNQAHSIAEVTKAVIGGDLTMKIKADAHGEILELKETINGMEFKHVHRQSYSSGQAMVMNVGGTWNDLTDNVNIMATNVRQLVQTFFNLIHPGFYFFQMALLLCGIGRYTSRLYRYFFSWQNSINCYSWKPNRVF